MNFSTVLQVMTLLSMLGVIIEALYQDHLYFEDLEGQVFEEEVVLLMQKLEKRRRGRYFKEEGEEEIPLSKGSYYLGNSIVKSLIYSNYIRVRRAFGEKEFCLFLKVGDDVEVSVLDGKMRTSVGTYERDASRWIRVPGNRMFEAGTYRFRVT